MKRGGLRIEQPKASSGKLKKESLIPVLKEDNYIVEDTLLDGNAPKQLIRAYFYEKGSGVKKSVSKSWPVYIAKSAEKWYPVESVTEYMINRIGQALELNINEIKLVKVRGQIRFLSKYFLGKEENLIHGAEICGQYLGDMSLARQIANSKLEARSLFTFEFITEAIKSVFPGTFMRLEMDLFKMIVFDALVGNNDRHFYNWGVITTLKRSKRRPYFAPIYDSARGLMWNIPDKQLFEYTENKAKLNRYIKKSFPRISAENNKKANHFELLKGILEKNKNYKRIVKDTCNHTKEKEIMRILSKDIFPLLRKERIIVISELLSKRFEYLREV